MKQFLIILFSAALALPAHAALNVFAALPEWGALAQEIGGNRINVFVATNGLQDPHRVEARPSLIAHARNADLVLATGAELEIGWLPVVLRDSGNPKVQPGQPGYFEASRYVHLMEIPTRLDRADGDVHAAGNPHIQTDPRNFLAVGDALAQRLGQIDPANAAAYQASYKSFAEKWRAAIERWEKSAAPLRGLPIALQHKSLTYLIDWLGMKEVATLEPKPGVDPSVSYLGEVLARTSEHKPRLVLRAAYESARPAEWFSAQSKVPAVVLPFTVGGDEQAKDLFSLFDDTVARLLKGLQ